MGWLRYALGAAMWLSQLVVAYSDEQVLRPGAILLPRADLGLYMEPDANSRRAAWPPTSFAVELKSLDGQWLCVTTGCADGWLKRDDVVPCPDAVRYFSAKVNHLPTAFDYVGLGISRKLAGRHAAAESAFTSAIALEPGWARAYFERGEARSTAGDKAGAITDFGAVIERDASFLGAYISRGVALMARGDNEGALRDFNSAVARDGTLWVSRYNRGLAYLRLSRYNLAIRDFDQAVALNPGHADIFCDRAIAWRRLAKPGNALADLGIAVHLDARHGRALWLRARVFEGLGDLKSAEADYASAKSGNAKDPGYWNARGNFEASRGDYDAAKRYFDEAIRLDRSFVDAYLNRAVLALVRGHPDEADADVSAATRLDTHNANALTIRGCVRMMATLDFEAAIMDFSEAINIDKAFAKAYANRAVCWMDRNDPASALADWDAALRLAPDNQHSRIGRAYTLANLDRYEDALADVEAAIRQGPRNSEGYAARAWVRGMRQDASENDLVHAEGDALHACELTRWKDRFALSTLAAVDSWRGDFSAAAKRETEALSLCPPNRKHECRARLILYKQEVPCRRHGMEFEWLISWPQTPK